ncbi:MAG: hypothetical protein R3Y64_09470 [Peptostreptococcaceae bacterium]
MAKPKKKKNNQNKIENKSKQGPKKQMQALDISNYDLPNNLNKKQLDTEIVVSNVEQNDGKVDDRVEMIKKILKKCRGLVVKESLKDDDYQKIAKRISDLICLSNENFSTKEEMKNNLDVLENSIKDHMEKNMDNLHEIQISNVENLEKTIGVFEEKLLEDNKISNNKLKSISELIVEKNNNLNNIDRTIVTNTSTVGKVNNNLISLKNTLDYFADDFKSIRIISEEVNSLSKRMTSIKKNTDDLELFFSKIDKLEKNQTKIISTLEMFEGKLKLLDNLEGLDEKLSNANSSKENNEIATNLDEEILINLGNYGNKIIDELLLAGRVYARNKERIENNDQEKADYENKLIESKSKYKNEGIEQGKEDFIRDFIDKLDGIDTLFESENSIEQIMADTIKNQGFTICEELKKGQAIIINEENEEDYKSRCTNISDLGEYQVIQSAILLDGKIYKEANLEKVSK